MTGYTAQYPRPDHFLLHLSDTHLVAGDLLHGSVDSEEHLRRIFDGIERSGARPEAIVFTGDLADRGEPEAYATLRAIIEPAAARLGAQVIWVMGNHDDRATFRRELLGQLPTVNPVDRVYDIAGLRVIALDSTVPGLHHGEVSGEQLDWLAEELAVPAPHGTILAMHHPPIPSVLDLATAVELRDQAELADVVRGSDIRGIIAGHLHYSTTATFAGIPVSVASATCYTQDLSAAVGGTRGQDGNQAYNLIHIYDDTIVHSVVPTGVYPTVSKWVRPDEVTRILAANGIRIAPAQNAPVVAEEPLTVPIRETVNG